MNIIRSIQLYEKAKQVIPGGVNSPVRAFGSVGRTPLFEPCLFPMPTRKRISKSPAK